MLWNYNQSEWFPAHKGFSRVILLCVHVAKLLASADSTSEPQKQLLEIIDLNAENMKQHRRLAPISGYVQYGGNLVGDTNSGLFGGAVAIDETGTTIVVRELGTDTVRVYRNAANGWTQKGQDLTGFPDFGARRSVAISGDGGMVAVSSPDNRVVVVFQHDTSTEMWSQRGNTIQGFELDGSPISSFGYAISLTADGNKVAVGAPFHDSPTEIVAGFATTYFWNGTDWQRDIYFETILSSTILSGLYGEVEFAQLGASISFSGDGNWIAVGMRFSGSSDSEATRFGECRVYNIEFGSILLQDITGGAMFGSAVNDEFGLSVVLNYDGSIIAVGSPGFDVRGAEDVGRVQVFERTGELWIKLGSDLIGEEQLDAFGYSVDLSDDGKTLVAGSSNSFRFSSFLPGYARIYKFDGTDWVLQEISRAQGFDIDGIRVGDELGYSVAVSGDGTKVIVGAPGYEDIPSATDDGPNNGLVQMWGQTDFPTFSPILNPLPQVGNLGTGGSPAQASFVSRAYTWWQGAASHVEGFLFN